MPERRHFRIHPTEPAGADPLSRLDFICPAGPRTLSSSRARVVRTPSKPATTRSKPKLPQPRRTHPDRLHALQVALEIRQAAEASQPSIHLVCHIPDAITDDALDADQDPCAAAHQWFRRSIIRWSKAQKLTLQFVRVVEIAEDAELHDRSVNPAHGLHLHVLLAGIPDSQLPAFTTFCAQEATRLATAAGRPRTWTPRDIRRKGSGTPIYWGPVYRLSGIINYLTDYNTLKSNFQYINNQLKNTANVRKARLVLIGRSTTKILCNDLTYISKDDKIQAKQSCQDPTNDDLENHQDTKQPNPTPGISPSAPERLQLEPNLGNHGPVIRNRVLRDCWHQRRQLAGSHARRGWSTGQLSRVLRLACCRDGVCRSAPGPPRGLYPTRVSDVPSRHRRSRLITTMQIQIVNHTTVPLQPLPAALGYLFEPQPEGRYGSLVPALGRHPGLDLPCLLSFALQPLPARQLRAVHGTKTGKGAQILSPTEAAARLANAIEIATLVPFGSKYERVISWLKLAARLPASTAPLLHEVGVRHALEAAIDRAQPVVMSRAA